MHFNIFTSVVIAHIHAADSARTSDNTVKYGGGRKGSVVMPELIVIRKGKIQFFFTRKSVDDVVNFDKLPLVSV